MKKSKLLAIIDKAINEVLDESTIDVASPGVLTPQQKQAMIVKARTTSKNPKLGTADDPIEFVEEGELDEARRYGIADAEKAQALINAAVGKSKGRIQQIVDAINAAGGRLSGGGIANALNVIQPQINSLLKAMVENGILDIEGGKAFTTAPTPGEEAPEEEPEMAGDETDLFVGRGDVDKTLSSYFKDEPKPEELAAVKTTSLAAAPKVGVWFDEHSDLIQAIIDKTKSASKRISSLREDEEIGSGDLKKSTLASKDWAKESLKTLIGELVSELIKVKQEDPAMFEKILVDLKQYKFGPTNTLLSYNMILKQLDAADVNASNIDTGDLELDEEEDTLPEPVMERFQKLAKIK
jgi:hypothetical protein